MVKYNLRQMQEKLCVGILRISKYSNLIGLIVLKIFIEKCDNTIYLFNVIKTLYLGIGILQTPTQVHIVKIFKEYIKLSLIEHKPKYIKNILFSHSK